MTKVRSRGITRSKWFLPFFSLVLGLVILAVTWLGGHPGVGIGSLVGLTAFGLFLTPVFFVTVRALAERRAGDAARVTGSIAPRVLPEPAGD